MVVTPHSFSGKPRAACEPYPAQLALSTIRWSRLPLPARPVWRLADQPATTCLYRRSPVRVSTSHEQCCPRHEAVRRMQIVAASPLSRLFPQLRTDPRQACSKRLRKDAGPALSQKCQRYENGLAATTTTGLCSRAQPPRLWRLARDLRRCASDIAEPRRRPSNAPISPRKLSTCRAKARLHSSRDIGSKGISSEIDRLLTPSTLGRKSQMGLLPPVPPRRDALHQDGSFRRLSAAPQDHKVRILAMIDIYQPGRSTRLHTSDQFFSKRFVHARIVAIGQRLDHQPDTVAGTASHRLPLSPIFR